LVWHLIWNCFAFFIVITDNFLRGIMLMYFDKNGWKRFRKKSCRLFDRLCIAQQQVSVYWNTFFYIFISSRWSNIWSMGSHPGYKLEPTDRQRMMRCTWKKAAIMYNCIRNALEKKKPPSVVYPHTPIGIITYR